MANVRVRFAPSPTGYLHVGGARTALFNWLFARHHGGTFILRIEDTDRTRSTEEAIVQIQESLRWLGLDWDEYYRQTERFERHREVAEVLRRKGVAYESEGALWFKAPVTGTTAVEDLILGRVEFANSEFKDFVILRSDGTPTYNFACVVDDHDMGMTHVIRGDEHMNNTPKQLWIYGALGWDPPAFAHIPLILGPDRTKLSKRHGAVSVLEYRRRGFLPEALVNFLARLGWSHGDQEIFTREELIRYFDLDGVRSSAAVFDETKLLWLNHEWLKRTDPERLADLLAEYIVQEGVATREAVAALGRERLMRAAELLRERNRTLVDMAHAARFLFPGEIPIPDEAKELFRAELAGPLEEIAKALEALEDFSPEGVESCIRGKLQELGLKLRDVALPIRVAVSGRKVGPGLFDLLSLAGKEITVSRLRSALQAIKSGLE
ncbi:MAG TPA: glutamate--tRNA ligase [Candidatus Acetothermia bacterium]|nr:glutamate--tRNA ligase [Candidatus Acetothermia bacterium]